MRGRRIIGTRRIERDDRCGSLTRGGHCAPLPPAGEVDARSAAGEGTPLRESLSHCLGRPHPSPLPQAGEGARCAGGAAAIDMAGD
ncbi:hypothetical protein D4Q52_23250 [Rhodopseudomonas palustris]|uniref:Uncharacterized protein n=1 Tax=Rhodopseudomonas palustris TaxID=1076 RepID=A0A418UYH4_RHOPL|nr:hypothetical protein D4Q52_23250 [Rhodopseudomonas palustris]